MNSEEFAGGLRFMVSGNIIVKSVTDLQLAPKRQKNYPKCYNRSQERENRGFMSVIEFDSIVSFRKKIKKNKKKV